MQNLTPGPYWGKLIDAGLGEIGNNKTPAMILAFSVTHYGEAGNWKDMTPETREVNFFLTDGARDRSFDDLRALGFNGDFDNPTFNAEVRDGMELDIVNEPYNGKVYDKVRIAKLKPASNRAPPVSADVTRRLAAQFKQSASTAAKPSAPPPPRPAAPVAAEAAAPVRSGPPSSGNDEPPL